MYLYVTIWHTPAHDLHNALYKLKDLANPKTIEPKHAYWVLITAIEKATENNLYNVLKESNNLIKIISPENNYVLQDMVYNKLQGQAYDLQECLNILKENSTPGICVTNTINNDDALYLSKQ